ncbi:hypothetical protein FB446DRAFT_187041 [Lentinula raphanica]|nr:hypothetical protein FB446DRAFT_187041 [Lentinula raphanica]
MPSSSNPSFDEGTHDEKHEYKTLLVRGTSQSSRSAQALFIIYRSVDVLMQYMVLLSEIYSFSRGESVTSRIHSTVSHLPRAVLFLMVLIAYAKQIYWVLAVSSNTVTPTTSFLISLFNLTCNSANTLLFVYTSSSTYARIDLPSPSPMLFGIGLFLFLLGITLEWSSEIQRTNFKKDPRNKGKIFTRGLFGYARHVNYSGYICWRTGFALASAGWTWALFVFSAFVWDFMRRGIPELEVYCEKKYGEQWERYKDDVPYRLLPFVV